MTPVESEIASFVLENMKSVSQMNIMELSEAIPVSKSAIHRFCKKLNFQGFNDMKVQIAKDSCESYHEDILMK